MPLGSNSENLQKAGGAVVEDMVQRSKLAERTETSVEEISWRVGYEDAAFFRRLFKRTTGLAPGADRKRFCIPYFAGK